MQWTLIGVASFFSLLGMESAASRDRHAFDDAVALLLFSVMLAAASMVGGNHLVMSSVMGGLCTRTFIGSRKRGNPEA